MSIVEKGQTFDTADSAISFVESFAKQHFHPLRKRHCISVENYNKRVTNKSALPLRLKFYNIQWECKHAGKPETGRKNRVKKLGCPVEIGACYDRDLQKFVVVRLNLDHNHRLEGGKGCDEDKFDENFEAVDECEVGQPIVKSRQCPDKFSNKRKAGSPVKCLPKKNRKVKIRYKDDDDANLEEEVKVTELRPKDEKNVSTKRPYRKKKIAQVDTSNETIPVKIEVSFIPLEKEILPENVKDEMGASKLGNSERDEISFESEKIPSVNEDYFKPPSTSGGDNILIENRTGNAVEQTDNKSLTYKYSEELLRQFFEDGMPRDDLNAVGLETLYEKAEKYDKIPPSNQHPRYTNDRQLENFLLNYDYDLGSKIFGDFNMADISPGIHSDDPSFDLFPELESKLTEFGEKLDWSREHLLPIDDDRHCHDSVLISLSDELRIFGEEINSTFQGMEMYDNLMELFGRIHSENSITKEEFDSELSKILTSQLEGTT